MTEENIQYPLFVECPHCRATIEVEKLNCCIFRCGIYKKDNTQIPPHLPKPECDRLFAAGLIHGCGRPFRYDMDTRAVVICDYI